MTATAVSNAMTLSDISDATKQDPLLQILKTRTEKNDWHIIEKLDFDDEIMKFLKHRKFKEYWLWTWN